MIKLHITSKNYDLGDDVVAYVERKIGRLDRYLPRNSRDLSGQVILELDPSGREDNKFVCEAIIELPGPNAHAKEATLNIYAAIDIVEAKLKVQIRKYKDKHSGSRLRRSKDNLQRLFNRGREPGE
ncbi:MAG TPA: ribosome-associated translation inhibitor RaiA [Candidatus Saccharimonadales bacterium]|nr:ribosome-associated translation inhibitor RaiA [Candidatus Saccharimonadales bacterium]